jgi:hypothetical protein
VINHFKGGGKGMKQMVVRRVAGAVAVVFSLLTLVEGSRVLLGTAETGCVVLMPLLLYNVVMAFVGMVAGGGLWMGRKWGLALSGGIAASHIVVLLIVGALYTSGGDVALRSVQAMILRSVVWTVVAWIGWKTVTRISAVQAQY